MRPNNRVGILYKIGSVRIK